MKLTVYCEPVAMTALTTQKTPPNNHSDGAHYCSADGQGEEPDPQNNDDHQKYCFDLETPLSLNAYMYVFNVPRHVHVCNLAGPVGEAACQRKSSGARLERLSDVPEGTERITARAVITCSSARPRASRAIRAELPAKSPGSVYSYSIARIGCNDLWPLESGQSANSSEDENERENGTSARQVGIDLAGTGG